jgi:hypothetical protein
LEHFALENRNAGSSASSWHAQTHTFNFVVRTVRRWRPGLELDVNLLYVINLYKNDAKIHFNFECRHYCTQGGEGGGGRRKYIRIIVRGFCPDGNKDLYIVYVRCTLHCLLKIFMKTQINQKIKRAALFTFKYILLYCVRRAFVSVFLLAS